MACPQTGPCSPFAVQADLCCLSPTGAFPDPCLAGGEPLPVNAITNSLEAASELLWAVTGRRYGTCEVTIRPCKTSCGPCEEIFSVGDFRYGFGFPFTPHLIDGIWFNIDCACAGECGCTRLQQIPLPYPVCEVSEVKLDGDVFPASGYRVDEFKYLVRTDGGKWPHCQDLQLADTEEDTFSVTLTYGREVPSLLRQATAELACQFLKSCVGAPCQLPQRIQTITRQGVTVGFIDPQEFFEGGRIGIYLVDLAIEAFNPHRITRRPAIWSPDAGPKWRRVGT